MTNLKVIRDNKIDKSYTFKQNLSYFFRELVNRIDSKIV